ncbi:MAG: pyridoxamine 5'-phosphate oxidase family protein [Bacteroidales bacterium]|nr:pyridoxamine 5'-phosphate oxidase family protein [Bacteroidales bacterium]
MKDKALEFLSKHNEVSFATCEANKPKIRVFQIMKIQDNDLYFATSPKKEVFKQLKQNPCIEIMSFYGQISVKCTGKAAFDVDDMTKRWIFENNPVLPRLYDDYNALEYFRMGIQTIDYYDLSPTPPLFKHIDLTANTVSDGFVGDKYSG